MLVLYAIGADWNKNSKKYEFFIYYVCKFCITLHPVWETNEFLIKKYYTNDC